MVSPGPYDIVRPFLWIGLVAFLFGFGGYVLLAAVNPPARPQVEAARWIEAADEAGPPRAI